jgi:hypothetical protein
MTMMQHFFIIVGCHDKTGHAALLMCNGMKGCKKWLREVVASMEKLGTVLSIKREMSNVKRVTSKCNLQ